MLLIAALVFAYLLGSIPTSYIVAKRVKGIDLRRHGSGNLGATNIVRTLGPGWGVFVLVLDMAKGAAAVLVMTLVVSRWPHGEPTPLHVPPDLWRIIAGFTAALGHTVSAFMGFKGGKGVATTAGAYFILAPYPTLVAVAVFGFVFAIGRIVSLASLAAAAVLPVAVGFFEWRSSGYSARLIFAPGFSKTIFFFTLAISAWVIWRHRANIRRLQQGREQQLDLNGGPSTDDQDPQKDRRTG